MPGFPIRTSSDQRSVDSSPRLIAASYVLHRLPVPRHPPCALKHLQHKKPIIRRKIAHQFVRNNAPPNLKGRQPHSHELDARNHYPQIKHHTPPPKQGNNTPTPSTRSHPRKGTGLLSQGPIVCLAVHRNSVSHTASQRLLCTKPAPLQRSSSSRLTPSPTESVSRGAP